MYKISEYSSKIKNLETGEVFEQDDRLPSFKNFEQWQKSGGAAEFVPFFAGEENEKKKAEFLPQLQKVFFDNELKGKALVIDKNGKKAYIESQERHYVLKYKVAKGLITNAKITALHEIEAADLGITLEQLHYVIVWKYETADFEFTNISACNETCRCRIQTHLEQEQWQKFESCMAIYQNLICEDYELLTNQLLAI